MKNFIFFFSLSFLGIIQPQQKIFAQLELTFKTEISYTSLYGGFDGESALVGSDVLIMVPDLDPGYGFGLSVGGWTNNYDTYISIKYARSKFNATFLGESLGKANYNVFGLPEVTWFFPEEWPHSNTEGKPTFQFFLGCGFEFGTLRVKDSFIDSTIVKDASYSWIGVPVGTGIAFNLKEKYSITIGINYRLATATTVKVFADVDPGTNIEKFGGMGGLFYDVGFIFPITF